MEDIGLFYKFIQGRFMHYYFINLYKVGVHALLFYKFIQGRFMHYYFINLYKVGVHALLFYKFIQGRGSCISIL